MKYGSNRKVRIRIWLTIDQDPLPYLASISIFTPNVRARSGNLTSGVPSLTKTVLPTYFYTSGCRPKPFICLSIILQN